MRGGDSLRATDVCRKSFKIIAEKVAITVKVPDLYYVKKDN